MNLKTLALAAAAAFALPALAQTQITVVNFGGANAPSFNSGPCGPFNYTFLDEVLAQGGASYFDMFAFNTEPPDEFEATCRELGQPFRTLRNGEGMDL